MVSNRLALAAVAAACISAAGAGGYLATRHNVAGMAAPDAAAASAQPAPQPVQETEALIPPAAKTIVPAPPPAASIPAASATSSTASTPTSKRSVNGAPTRQAAQSASGSTRKAEPPQLEKSWPSSTQAQTPAPAPSADAQAQSPVHAEDRQPEAARAPEPPAKQFQELTVATDSVVGLQTDTALSSERSKVEDRVEAHVVRDVRVNGEVAIPAGTKALGTVVAVDRGGKFKERARLGIRFQTLVMADGTRLPITTETIYRYGNSPTNASAAKIGGGAVVGAIIGGIIGGGKGAAIGATTGAGAGTATVMAGDRDVAAFPSGSEVTARILSPVTVTVERE